MSRTQGILRLLFSNGITMKKPYLHPNHKVKDWLQHYWLAGITVAGHKHQHSSPAELHKAIEDVLVGVSWLGASGFHGQPKVIPNHVLAILATQEVISTETVTRCLGERYKPSTIKNYVSASRTASRAIYQYIVTNEDEVLKDIYDWTNADEDSNDTWSQLQLEAWHGARNLYRAATAGGVRGPDLAHLQIPKNIYMNLVGYDRKISSIS